MNTIAIICAKYLWVIPPILVLWYLWKTPAVRKSFTKFAVLVLPLSYIVAKIASHFYFDPRPFVVSGVAPLIAHAADNGFPSDHTLLVASLAAVMMFYNRKLAMYLWIIAVVVAASRVFVGVHHVIDVVSSIIISLVSAAVIYFIRKNKTTTQ